MFKPYINCKCVHTTKCFAHVAPACLLCIYPVVYFSNKVEWSVIVHSYTSMLCMHAMPPDTDCWVPPGASTARSSWQGHPWLQTSVTEKMLQILRFPLLRNKLLTVNTHLRNPESWHFCGVTVGWSSVPIEKSQRGGQRVHTAAAGGGQIRSRAKILHLASNNVPDPKSL